MVFSSIVFLIYFLPAALGVYFLVPAKWKNPVLLIASLIFYAWGSFEWVWLILSECFAAWLAALWMDRQKDAARKAIFAVSVTAIVVILFWFKYYDFFILQIEGMTGLKLFVNQAVLPLGISFYTFQILSYLIDVYRKDAKVQKSFWSFLLYICMFFQLVAGPIVRYGQIADQLHPHPFKWSQIERGSSRFVCGLSKKVLLANPLWAFEADIQLLSQPVLLTSWLGAFAAALYVYFDFSGYSDMAIGLAEMCGYSLPENFRYPFLAGSFAEFWRRWHMSLTGWFRDYIYISLGGSRRGIPRQILALLTVWLLTGLWHGAAWNFILWGLLFFVLLCLEKFLLPDRMQNHFAYRIVVIIILAISFVLFQDESLAQFALDLRNLFGFSHLPFADARSLVLVRSNLVLMTAAAAACFPFGRQIWSWLSGRKAGYWICLLVMMTAFVCCIAELTYGSWNPFLYFRF